MFNNFLNNCNLIDLGYNGPRFTWTNKRDNGLVMKRLDKALANSQWKLLFNDSHVCHLPRTFSDHHPILLHTTSHTFQPLSARPFHLETMWFSNPLFPTIVQNSWNYHPYDIISAMDDFTHHVKVWNANSFGNIFHKKKKRTLARLNGIQKALCNNYNTFLKNLKNELLNEYQQILRLEEEF